MSIKKIDPIKKDPVKKDPAIGGPSKEPVAPKKNDFKNPKDYDAAMLKYEKAHAEWKKGQGQAKPKTKYGVPLAPQPAGEEPNPKEFKDKLSFGVAYDAWKKADQNYNTEYDAWKKRYGTTYKANERKELGGTRYGGYTGYTSPKSGKSDSAGVAKAKGEAPMTGRMSKAAGRRSVNLANSKNMTPLHDMGLKDLFNL
jgi:hypothetical protein